MSASRVVGVALILALGPPALAQELPPGLGAWFEDGVRALKAGELDEAEAAFRSVLDGGGEVAYVRNNLGIVYQRRGEHERAIAEFQAAVGLDSSYVAPRLLLGASLLALGRVDEATIRLQEAVTLEPGQPLGRLQLAKAYEHARDWAGAVEQYRALRELAPDDPEHAYGLGRAYLRLSEWCLAQLKGLDSGSARLQQALGHTYRVQGRPDLALRAFEQASQADPTLPELHLAMAQIHMEQGRWGEARQEIERELALIPDSAGARALARHLQALEARSP